jgi:hypothetical protein
VVRDEIHSIIFHYIQLLFFKFKQWNIIIFYSALFHYISSIQTVSKGHQFHRLLAENSFKIGVLLFMKWLTRYQEDSNLKPYKERNLMSQRFITTPIHVSFFFWKILTSAPRALVKEANIVKFYWKLCSQPLKDEKNIVSI